MSKTLHCEIGNHDWTHPGGRGRPPKNCPEHKPAAPEPKRAVSYTEHAEAIEGAEKKKPNPFIKKAKDRENRKKMEKARGGKVEKKVERTEADREQLAQERAELPSRIRQAEERYKLANDKLRAAQTSEEIEKAGNAALQVQNALMNLYTRQRKLDSDQWLQNVAHRSQVMAGSVDVANSDEATPAQKKLMSDIDDALESENPGETFVEARASRPLSGPPKCRACNENLADPDFEGDADFAGLCDDCAELLLEA